MGFQGGVLLLTCIAVYSAAAENLTDPTRPPTSGRFNDTRDVAAVSGPVLQSIRISSAQKVAIISGQAIPLGAKFRDATIVKITETEVTLARGRETQVLKLFPGMEKRLTSAHVSTRTDIRR